MYLCVVVHEYNIMHQIRVKINKIQKTIFYVKIIFVSVETERAKKKKILFFFLDH